MTFDAASSVFSFTIRIRCPQCFDDIGCISFDLVFRGLQTTPTLRNAVEVNIAFIDNFSTLDALCIMVNVRYGRLMVPILETTVRASPFHLVFLIRHQSTQRLYPICTIRDTDNVKLSDLSSHRYNTRTRILAAAIGIATRLRNTLTRSVLLSLIQHYDARHRAKPGTKQEHR